MKKISSLLTLTALPLLTGCGNAQAATPSTVDVITNPTTIHGNTADALVAAMQPDGPWVFSMQDHIVVDGPLYIEGQVPRHMDGVWQDFDIRLIAMYYRPGRYGGSHGSFDLTVTDGIHIYSYPTWLHGHVSEGNYSNIYADVYVNSYSFQLRDAIIHGNLTFATEGMKYWSSAYFWNEAEWRVDEMAWEDVVRGEVRVATSS